MGTGAPVSESLIKAAKTIALGSRDAETYFDASADRQASSDRRNRSINMSGGNDDDDDDDMMMI